MPEIPEIETLRQHLLANCLNKKVIQLETIREKTFNLPLGQINNYLENRTITNVLRKDKIIIIQFDNNSSLYFHLMLDGFLKFTQPNEKLNPDLQDKYQLNEGLFLGQVLPNRKASELSEKELEKLYYQLNILLKDAIKQGGTGQIPFSSTDQITGGYRQELKVSYREGEPCFVCGTPITYQKIGGRNAFYCHICQH